MKWKKIKDRYEKFKRDNNKQTYNDCAKIIVGFKIVKHIIFKLPKAIEEKKNDTSPKKQNSLYKKESVFDYLEEPDFDYRKEVEKVSDKMEEAFDKGSKIMRKIREKTSPFYWLKKFIAMIKNRNTKLLTDGNSKEQYDVQDGEGTKKQRTEFIERLRNNIDLDKIRKNEVELGNNLVRQNQEDRKYEEEKEI